MALEVSDLEARIQYEKADGLFSSWLAIFFLALSYNLVLFRRVMDTGFRLFYLYSLLSLTLSLSSAQSFNPCAYTSLCLSEYTNPIYRKVVLFSKMQ